MRKAEDRERLIRGLALAGAAAAAAGHSASGYLDEEQYNRRMRRKISRLVSEEVLAQLPLVVVENLSMRDVAIISEVQRRVFAIDYYGERNASLNFNVLGYLWDQLQSIVKYRSDLEAVCSEELERLRAYQDFEEAIHGGYWPNSDEGLAALPLKSADVVLLQKLAIVLSGRRTFLADIERYRSVAEAREIFDDLWDVEEDHATWNFNLFLAGPGCRDLRVVGASRVRAYVDNQAWDEVWQKVGGAVRRDDVEGTRHGVSRSDCFSALGPDLAPTYEGSEVHRVE